MQRSNNALQLQTFEGRELKTEFLCWQIYTLKSTDFINKPKDMDARKGPGGEGLQRLSTDGNCLLKHY